MVCKRVRRRLTPGAFGEHALGADLRVVHENLTLASAPAYKPLLEVTADDGATWAVEPDHLWTFDYSTSVVLREDAAAPAAGGAAFALSFYEYTGRVGPTPCMLRPSTDLVAEGRVNRYMRRESVEAWAGAMIAKLTTDDIAEGERNTYARGDGVASDAAAASPPPPAARGAGTCAAP